MYVLVYTLNDTQCIVEYMSDMCMQDLRKGGVLYRIIVSSYASLLIGRWGARAETNETILLRAVATKAGQLGCRDR